MKKLLATVVVVALLASLGVGLVSVVSGGNSLPASKATAVVKDWTIIPWQTANMTWTPILVQNIKTANDKDLFIDVSLESGLYTYTHVKSKRNSEGDPNWDTSTAHAKIAIRVVVDNGTAMKRMASPGEVIFNEREQELSAKFMGIFTGSCLTANTTTGEVTLNYACLEPEELKLTLETLMANSFNFVIADLSSGEHSIQVEATIVVNEAWQEGNADAMALIGRGSVTIEEVRMIRGEDWLVPAPT
jgi:hypothetical protein